MNQEDTKETPGDAIGEVKNDLMNSENLFKRKMNKTASFKKDVSELLDVNMGYLFAYVACYSLSVWHTTWALAGNSQTTTVF